MSALDEHLPSIQTPPPAPGSLLAQLQDKKHQIFSQDNEFKRFSEPVKSSGDTWLRELQAKQAALRMKKNQANESNKDMGVDVVNTQRSDSDGSKVTSVKDLASRFENNKQNEVINRVPSPSYLQKCPTPTIFQNYTQKHFDRSTKNDGVLSLKKREEHEAIAPEQIAEEIREVEMLNAVVQKTLNSNQQDSEDAKQNRYGKKKSVSFCDQVILVATV